MENKEINIMTNSELKSECEKLSKEYKEKQKIASETLGKMIELSNRYNEITALLKKREGKTND